MTTKKKRRNCEIERGPEREDEDEDKDNDFLYSIYDRSDDSQLNYYFSLVLQRMEEASAGDQEISRELREVIYQNLRAFQSSLKILIVLHMINIDDWLKSRITQKNIPEGESRLFLSPEFQQVWFLGLSKLCERNLDMKIPDGKFLKTVLKLYEELKESTGDGGDTDGNGNGNGNGNGIGITETTTHREKTQK